MIIAMIPARGGSKRIPGKNLKKIGSKSLVEWSVSTAMLCKNLGIVDTVVISSDDPVALEQGKALGAVPIKRDPEACTDDATDYDVIINTMVHSPWYPHHKFSYLVYLRPTTPFRKIHDVRFAMDQIKSIPDATGLRSVHEMSESAYKAMELLPGGHLCRMQAKDMRDVGDQKTHYFNVDSANLPNHFYPKTYSPNGVVDIMKWETIAGCQTYGDDVIGYITKPTIEIDTQEDLEMARLHYVFQRGGYTTDA